jgi:uncharacterized protein (DUF58 family)
MIQLSHWSLVFFLLGAPLWLISPQIASSYLFIWGALLLLDLFLLPRKSQVTVERILPEHFVIDVPSQICWKVKRKEGVLQDHFPGQSYCIKTDSELLTQTYCPNERGRFLLTAPSLRLKGCLYLLYREYFFEFEEAIKVYPNCRSPLNPSFAAFGKPEMTQNKTLKVYQRGGELESLRPYIQGEDLRNVEWKISAKKGEMVCKNWEMENDRHISVLIDCGRRSAEIAGARSLLDHSLNATAQLCRLIQNKQDTFSLYAFSNKIEASLPKTDKKSVTQKTLETIYQLKPQSVESDYWQVIGQVMHKLTKRSLLILFSNVLDTAGSLGLINNLTRASQKHLVLCVVMKDQKLEEAANADDPYRRAAACYLLLERERAIKHMRAKGIHVLDASTSSYISEVIQHYLRIREKI